MNAKTNQISKPSRTSPPGIDPNVVSDLAMARNALIRDYPAMPPILAVPMESGMRSRLDHRRRQLEGALAPTAKSDHPQMAAAIAGLLGAFGGGNAPGSPEIVVAKYVQVLEDLPLWAVQMACRALERGEVDGASMDFRPAAPRLRQVARSLMAPWDEELFHLREVLRAPAMEPQDEAMRERIGKLITEFASDFRMGKFR